MELMKAKEDSAEMRSIPTTKHHFNWVKEIWNLNSSPKTKMLLWKAARGALPVAANLVRRNVTPSADCCRCGLEETAEHALFLCDFAKKVWELAPLHKELNLNQITSIKKGICGGNKIMCLPPSGVSNPIFPWIYASIWAARNLKLFEDRSFSETEALSKALTDAREWQEAQLPIEKSCKPKEKRVHQGIRDPNCIYIFTDASWNKGTRDAGLGWTCHDATNRQLEKGKKMPKVYQISLDG